MTDITTLSRQQLLAALNRIVASGRTASARCRAVARQAACYFWATSADVALMNKVLDAVESLRGKRGRKVALTVIGQVCPMTTENGAFKAPKGRKIAAIHANGGWEAAVARMDVLADPERSAKRAARTDAQVLEAAAKRLLAVNVAAAEIAAAVFAAAKDEAAALAAAFAAEAANRGLRAPDADVIAARGEAEAAKAEAAKAEAARAEARAVAKAARAEAAATLAEAEAARAEAEAARAEAAAQAKRAASAEAALAKAARAKRATTTTRAANAT